MKDNNQTVIHIGRFTIYEISVTMWEVTEKVDGIENYQFTCNDKETAIAISNKLAKIDVFKINGMFATPLDFKTIESWIMAHNTEDQIHLWTAAMMINNLIVKTLGETYENE